MILLVVAVKGDVVHLSQWGNYWRSCFAWNFRIWFFWIIFVFILSWSTLSLYSNFLFLKLLILVLTTLPNIIEINVNIVSQIQLIWVLLFANRFTWLLQTQILHSPLTEFLLLVVFPELFRFLL
jgi:hypothetical protein